MDSPQAQLADRLKSANNILVTVSRNPSVDQLAACIGLSLLLNKMNKHSVAVFSGQVPSTLEFLKPDETIEKNTDSLRDFIIALDKDKADKLRYKVEDNVVRIFITPYRTSISEKDLEFSQGDFNVDVVVGLGVKQQEDLDGAITAHGRILHDATVASVTLTNDAGLGSINWNDPQASSLSELMTDLAQLLGDKLLDNQIATALLTGIVAETNRFSNDKTSSQTMTASSVLMAAGANQQLVANKLEKPGAPKPPSAAPPAAPAGSDKQDNSPPDSDGTLSIDHDKPGANQAPPSELPAPQADAGNMPQGDLPPLPEPPQPPEPPKLPEPPTVPGSGSMLQPGARLMTEPPALGGTLSANTQPEGFDPVTDPLSMPSSEPGRIISPSGSSVSPNPQPQMSPAALTPPPADWTPPAQPPSVISPSPGDNQTQTLREIEQSVHSPHLEPSSSLNEARDEVSKALSNDANTEPPTPIQALNAQPLGDNLHIPPPAPPQQVVLSNEPVLPLGPTPTESSDTNPQPSPSPDMLSPSPQVSNPTAPPPVPPPLPPQYLNNSGPNAPAPPAL